MRDIESALRELKIDYKLSGDEAMARCPSHNDRHPSWSVNTRTGVHHCFSCGFSGNLASLVVFLLDLSYPEAVIWCNERVGWSRAHQWREDKDNINLSPPVMKVSEADLAFFINVPGEELNKKGITEEAAGKLEILWNPKDKSWIFPVRDPFTNELWGWQSKNARTFRHYPAGIRRSETLFGLGTFPDGSTAVLVESPVDVAYLRSAGISNGLSSFGVQVSNRQFSIIQYISESLVLAFDNDLPGVDQTARICEKDDGVRVFSYVIDPEAKDPGEMDYRSVRAGITGCISSLKFLNLIRKNKELKQALDIYRNSGRLPKPSEREIFRPWLTLGRLRNGPW